MANPAFTPETSTNQIYRDQDTDRCLTDDLDAMDVLIDGKANVSHTHTAADVGAAAASHTHNYAATSHTHGQSEVTGLADALAAKANASALSGKADLVSGKVPANQLPSYVDDVVEYSAMSAFPATGESGKIYVATDTNKAYRWSGSAYVEISQGVTLGETSATAYRGDRGKIAYDHSQNSTVHVTAAQKTAWDGKADGNHTHDYAATSHTHSQTEIEGLGTALNGKAAYDHTHSGYAASNHTHTGYAASSHTHTAASIGAAASSHNHDNAYVPFDLFGFNNQGGVEYSYGSGSGKNVLTEISNMPQGLHTIYAIAGTTGNPETTESYRYFIHKTSSTIGWIWAFGADGSIYSNYQSAAGTFKGWRTIYDAKRKPLWTGSYYMTAGHTATPSKKLSQCEHGWLLLWSDYDPDTNTVNNTDFATTMIPNRSWAGATWNGSSFYCDVPRYSAGTATDSESRVIKLVTIYDNKIVGTDANNAAPRNDVVLRAVYEI